jgi:hypothetical protein
MLTSSVEWDCRSTSCRKRRLLGVNVNGGALVALAAVTGLAIARRLKQELAQM